MTAAFHEVAIAAADRVVNGADPGAALSDAGLPDDAVGQTAVTLSRGIAVGVLQHRGVVATSMIVDLLADAAAMGFVAGTVTGVDWARARPGATPR